MAARLGNALHLKKNTLTWWDIEVFEMYRGCFGTATSFELSPKMAFLYSFH